MGSLRLLPFNVPPVVKRGMLGQLVGAGAVVDTSRACFAGGTTDNGNAGMSDVIDYVEITTEGDASDFGDILAATRLTPAGTSNVTRGLFSGGYTGSATDVIQYITIDSTGDAEDFGNLSLARQQHGGLSSYVP